MVLRRENWNGRFVVTVRDKGKIVSWRLWSPKTFTLKDAASKFNQDKTFTEGVRKQQLTNVVEIIDTRKQPRKGKFFQYIFVGKIKVGGRVVDVTGRSDQVPMGTRITGPREQARERFFNAISSVLFSTSDPRLGMEALDNNKVFDVEEGTIVYEDIKTS